VPPGADPRSTRASQRIRPPRPPDRREQQPGSGPRGDTASPGAFHPGPSTATQPVARFGRSPALPPPGQLPERGPAPPGQPGGGPPNGRPTEGHPPNAQPGNGKIPNGQPGNGLPGTGGTGNGQPTNGVPGAGMPGTGRVQRPTATGALNQTTTTASGATRRADQDRSPGTPEQPNPLDSPASATAARLVAEGRARMASQPEDDATSTSRRDRRDNRFDLASLAALPGELRERFTAGRRRHKARIAAYTPKQRLWRRLRLAALGVVGVFIVLPTLLFFIGYLCFSIPTPDDAVNRQIATINFADGSSMAKVVPTGGNRIKVTADQIPKVVQYAATSAEDRTFFSNPGFDFTGIARAAYKQLTGGQGGGSTITQQFVKQTLVGDEHSLWRKYKEMIIAVKISQQSSKENILCDYLNAIYFGRGAYGIESASQAYFRTDVWKLNASQAALLAGLIQSPSRWDPAINPQHAAERWTYVIDGMVRMGWLSPQARAAASFPKTAPSTRTSSGIPSDYRGLILRAVRNELEKHGISEQDFNSEGLTVQTTIDPAAQQAAVDAEQKGLAGQPDNLRSSLVSIDPKTGAILAYYGGNYGVGLDYAGVSKQPGSTFKPFVLLADLLQPNPEGLGTRFKGEPLPGLRNADGASCQVCDLKQAMTISNNVIYHELGLRVGPQNVADAAKLAGITSPMKNPDAGIALGDREVTPVELASAYATIAAQGVYHEPHLVTKVTTSDDRVLYDAVDTDSTPRFSKQIARNVIEGMLGVPTYDKLGLSDGRPVAAKTGTVQSHIQDQNNDAWTAGFTPDMVSVVWVGTDQNTPIKDAKGKPIYGADLPGTIWKSYMYDATKDAPATSFGPFKPIGTPPAVVGPTDGFLAGGGSSTTDSPTQSSSTPDEAAGLPSSPAPEVEENSPQPSTRPSSQPNRVCDEQGCHNVSSGNDNGDSGSRNNRRSRNDRGDDNG
jgi:membrane peptidoglycan carboxypeptidase